jgi:hypothetical protein
MLTRKSKQASAAPSNGYGRQGQSPNTDTVCNRNKTRGRETGENAEDVVSSLDKSFTLDIGTNRIKGTRPLSFIALHDTPKINQNASFNQFLEKVVGTSVGG